jgi:hypothetical protein
MLGTKLTHGASKKERKKGRKKRERTPERMRLLVSNFNLTLVLLSGIYVGCTTNVNRPDSKNRKWSLRGHLCIIQYHKFLGHL